MVVGANCLLYMNQSSPSVGVSLNSITDCSTNFPLSMFKPAWLLAVGGVWPGDEATWLLASDSIGLVTSWLEM